MEMQDLTVMSKKQLEDLHKQINKIYSHKYKKRKNKRYGFNGYKAMSNEQIQLFFSGFYPHEFQYLCLFLIQSLAGLRIGEVCQIRLSDVDLINKSLHIKSEKQVSPIYHSVFIHSRLNQVLSFYIESYKPLIEKNGGYLFYKKGSSTYEHLSPNFARKVFREVCNRVNLTETYAERVKIDNNYGPLSPGKLHRFSTHSLRYWYIRHVLNSTGRIEIASLLARHRDIKTTMVYASPGQEDVKKASILAFS